MSLALSSTAALPLVNKAELAHRLGVSLPTLSNWLLKYPDFPIVERGTNGASYKFDASAVFAFLRARQEEQDAATAERDEQLSQLKLPFDVPGFEAAPPRPTVKEELDAWRLRRLQREEAERAGQLVPIAEVIAALETAMARLSRDMHAFLRQIGREQQWPDSYVRSVENRLAQQQRASVQDLQLMLRSDDDAERRVA